MCRISKKLIILFFVFALTLETFAVTIVDDGIERELDKNIAENISDGFYGIKNDDFDQFINDMCSFSTSVSRGNVTYIQKKVNSKDLLIGHSIVAFSGDKLKDEPIDIVGLVGGRLFYAEQCYKYLMPKYDKVIFWLGINDLLVERLLIADDAQVFADVISAFDSLYNKYANGNTKIYFMSVSPTLNGEFNNIIHNVNVYLSLRYNMIDVKYFPDLNEYHFNSSTFKKIYDESIKPVLNGEK